jgi:hypothetical protein
MREGNFVPQLVDQAHVPAHAGPRLGRKWLERGLLISILLAGAVALSANQADPDLWGHVQYGRDLLRDGLPATTTYSFTAQGYRWINHENLSEILLAIGADLLGPRGLLLAKCLLGLGVMGLILRHAMRQGAGMVAACFICLLVSINLTAHWSLRPQLMTYACYTLLLGLLSYCFQGWEGRWRLRLPGSPSEQNGDQLVVSSRRLRFLWLAPLLFLVWANSHGGFVAGYCIFSAYLLLRAGEAVSCQGKAALGLVTRLLMMVFVTGLATLVNPYGPSLHLWLLESLSVPRPEITEWHPPQLLSVQSLPMLLLVSTWGIVLVFSRRQRDFTHLVILTLTLWQTSQHARHLPFFALAFGFWAPLHVESILSRFHISRKNTSYGDEPGRPFHWVLAAGMCVAYALLGFKLCERLVDMPVKRDQFPVSAVQYMADRQLQGKLVVTYNWAQYLIAAFGDEQATDGRMLVEFDGRFRTCYPQEIVDMHFDLVLGDPGPGMRFRSEHSPPFDPNRVLEFGQPDLVLINRFQPHSERFLQGKQDTWVLLYQDQIAQLWGRRARYDDPDRPEYIAAAARRVTETPQQGSVTWPALPEAGSRLDSIASDDSPASQPFHKVAQGASAATGNSTAALGLLSRGLRVLQHSLRGN